PNLPRPRYFPSATGQGRDMVLELREVREAEEVGREGKRGGKGPVAWRGVLGLLPGGEAMSEAWCPWCHEWVGIREPRPTFAGDVGRCPDAPEYVKGAYRVPLY